MKCIIGKKIEMTSIFSNSGDMVAATRIKVSPNFVSQVKTEEKEGYKAIQLAFDKKKKIKNPQKGHLGKIGPHAVLKEFRVDKVSDFKVGQEIKASIFKEGEVVNITGFSKGKGFQGVVKRHGFKGAPATHGTKDQHRMPGSIGPTGPAHVFKGTRMPGRMGHNQTTVRNLQIIKINEKSNEIFVKGAVPGPRSQVLKIISTGKINEKTSADFSSDSSSDSSSKKSSADKKPSADNKAVSDKKEKSVKDSKNKKDK